MDRKWGKKNLERRPTQQIQQTQLKSFEEKKNQKNNDEKLLISPQPEAGMDEHCSSDSFEFISNKILFERTNDFRNRQRPKDRATEQPTDPKSERGWISVRVQ